MGTRPLLFTAIAVLVAFFTTCSSPLGLRTSDFTTPASTAVAAPQFSPSAGTYQTDQNVTITSTTAGATIYYTTGASATSTPVPTSSSGTVFNPQNPIIIANNGTQMTIRAVAIKAGLSDSVVATASYTINANQVSTPQFTPVAGIYAADQAVKITSATPGATIYYTTNGSTPIVGSSATLPTGNSILVAGNNTVETITAIAVKTGMTQSTTAQATYTITYPAYIYTQLDATNASWYAIAGSVTGSILVAAASTGTLEYSTSTGSSWLTSVQTGSWQAVSTDQSGTSMLAADRNGLIYWSADSGTNWAASDAPSGSSLGGWYGLGTAIGGYSVAVTNNSSGGQIYVSEANGQNWFSCSPLPANTGFRAVAESQNANYLTAVGGGSVIAISLNTGATWSGVTPDASNSNYNAVAMTVSGDTQALASNSGAAYISHDYGQSWTGPFNIGFPLYGTAVSSTGQPNETIFVVGIGYIGYTQNGGATWNQIPNPPGTTATTNWQSVTCDSTGKLVTVAANGTGGIWRITLP